MDTERLIVTCLNNFEILTTEIYIFMFMIR